MIEADCDKLAFFVDGVSQGDLSGDVDWTLKQVTVSGAGNHTLLWRYSKDSSGSDGDDRGYVDYLQWSGAGPIEPPVEWQTVSYTYDPAGRRIEKKVDGTTEVKFVYSGPHIIAEYDGGNNLLRKYVHGAGIDKPICMIEASGDYAGTYYYHYDALGSVVGLTNSAANMVELYEYSVYGQVAASDPNHPNRFMFTGREFDKDTGLYYYRARYYNPEIGRFLQTDPIGYGGGMNMHTYCRNNAVNWGDPTGLKSAGSDPCLIWLPMPMPPGAPIIIVPYPTPSPAPTPWPDVPVNPNPDDPIRVTVAFYDGGDKGGPNCANGAQFREAADDEYFDFSFDMTSQWSVFAVLDMLHERGYIVDKLYFYDHCNSSKGAFGLEFGGSILTGRSLQAFCEGLGRHGALDSSSVIHFRQCLVGSAEGGQFIKNLATWTGKSVTGGTMLMNFEYSKCPLVYDPGLESPGSDYFNGYANSENQALDEYGQIVIATPTLDSLGQVTKVEVGVYYTVTSRSMGDIY